jgi:hypothetical protein
VRLGKEQSAIQERQMCRDYDMAPTQFGLIRADHTVVATAHVRNARLLEDVATVTNDLCRESLEELLGMKLRLRIDADGTRDWEREICLCRQLRRDAGASRGLDLFAKIPQSLLIFRT